MSTVVSRTRESIQASSILDGNLENTTAVSIFSILSGIGGAIGGLVAAQRLAGVTTTIPFGGMIPAILISIAGTVAGAFLIPTGQ